MTLLNNLSKLGLHIFYLNNDYLKELINEPTSSYITYIRNLSPVIFYEHINNKHQIITLQQSKPNINAKTIWSRIDNPTLLPYLTSRTSKDLNRSHPLHGLSKLLEEGVLVDQQFDGVASYSVCEKRRIGLE